MKAAKAQEPKQSITAAEAFAAIELHDIDITHWPTRPHPPWRAACFVGDVYFDALAGTPLDAVEKLLRKIGGEECA